MNWFIYQWFHLIQVLYLPNILAKLLFKHLHCSVRPPKKSWKVISSLSGGEKTLSSLALVFALHHYKPTPLYVMDEIDAALDFKNVSIVANYIKVSSADMSRLRKRDVLVRSHQCEKLLYLHVSKIFKF